jgi:very-short-patch-repair endonuclease
MSSSLEKLLTFYILAELDIPQPTFEYKFHTKRKFRWDMAWVDQKLAVEVLGGIWIKGGHNTGKGITRDCEKLDEGVKLGWKVLQFTKEQIESGYAVEAIKEVLFKEAK